MQAQIKMSYGIRLPMNLAKRIKSGRRKSVGELKSVKTPKINFPQVDNETNHFQNVEQRYSYRITTQGEQIWGRWRTICHLPTGLEEIH